MTPAEAELAQQRLCWHEIGCVLALASDAAMIARSRAVVKRLLAQERNRRYRVRLRQRVA